MLTPEAKEKLVDMIESDEILLKAFKRMPRNFTMDQLMYVYHTEVIEEEYRKAKARITKDQEKVKELLRENVPIEEIAKRTDLFPEDLENIVNQFKREGF